MSNPVYEPSEDSQLIKSCIKKYCKGRVLDMGTGSGILAEEARKYSDDIVAVDINPDAIKYCKKNIKDIEFKVSDLFTSVTGKFDLIIFNPPYLPQEKDHDDPALYGGKKGYEIIVRFIDEAVEFLKPEGRILLLFSQLSHKRVIDDKIKDKCLISEEVAKRSIFFEKLYVYLIEKSPLLKELESKGYEDVNYLAHGKRGIIYTGFKNNVKYTVKSRNTRSTAIGRMENEAKWLKVLNKKGIGPVLVDKGKDYIIYKYVEGIYFDEFVKNNPREKIKEVISSLLQQARIMDQLMMDKEEMHRLTRNLLIGENVVLIDFERSRNTEKPRNITQLCQFIISGNVTRMIETKKITFERDKIRQLAGKYKKTHSDEDFEAINKLILSSI